MSINRYPEIKPGTKLLKRTYVAIMMWFLGRAIQAAVKIDPEVKKEFDTMPPNFTLRMMIYPEHAFPLFFYVKRLPAFVRDRGLLPCGMQMIIGKDQEGRVRYMGSDPKGEKINLHMVFKSLEAAMMVFTFRESTTTAYAHDRFMVEGDLPYALAFVRVLDIVEVYLLPKIVARLAVKRYPKWSEMSPIRKYINRVLVYVRVFTA
jgi:hypothetical protein